MATAAGALGAAGLALSAVTLLCAVWIVAPAPHRALAFLAVAAGELSAWGLVAALGAAGLGAAGAWEAERSGATWVGWAAVLSALAAGGLAVVPPVQAWRVAAAHGVALSPVSALGAIAPRDEGVEVSSVTFASLGGQALEMDVYRTSAGSGGARGADAKAGVIVVHGGAWVGGKRSELPRWNRWLVRRGYVVFDVDYRLAPQPNWEGATGDVLCAAGTIKAEAARWGVDPNRLALLGRSAGGHLALLAAYNGGSAGGVLPSCGARDATVQAVVSLYGPTDLIWGYENSANQRVIDGRRTLERFLGGTPRDAAGVYERASPLTHVRREVPPTLLLHGGRYQFAGIQHIERLAARLRAAGVPHETVLLPYAQHGFDFVFDGWSGQITQVTVGRFLERYVGR